MLKIEYTLISGKILINKIGLDKLYAVTYNNDMKQIIYYKTKSGKCPYLDWYKNLDNNIKNRVRARLERVEEDNFGDCKKIDSNLSELRFKFGSGYRIYYFEYENTIIILLTAGDKATQNKDIMKAKEYILDFEERYKND